MPWQGIQYFPCGMTSIPCVSQCRIVVMILHPKMDDLSINSKSQINMNASIPYPLCVSRQLTSLRVSTSVRTPTTQRHYVGESNK